MNIVSQSEAIKRGYKVKFDSEKENNVIVTNLEGRVIRYPCNDCGLHTREIFLLFIVMYNILILKLLKVIPSAKLSMLEEQENCTTT